MGYKFIKIRQGGSLLMVNGYTYSKHCRSNNYYCSKKEKGCKARLKIDQNGAIVNQDLNHQHQPPRYVLTASDVMDYKLIKTRKGGHLLMMNGYTFSKHNRSLNYYCSKKDRGCRARLKLDHNGVILNKDNLNHQHPPPQYAITQTGLFNELSFPRNKKRGAIAHA